VSSLFTLDCESCQLGKQHRASYPSCINNMNSSPFDLIHSDVLGPCRVTLIFGFGIFLVSVDDHSRMSWVYLLKDKTQVLDVIKTFINEIKPNFYYCSYFAY